MYSRLSAIFGVAALIGLAVSDQAMAQENQNFQPAEPQMHDTEADAGGYTFKPALCETIETAVSDEAKAITMDNERFSAIHEWADTEDGPDIFLYRLCHEARIFKPGYSVFTDVMYRLTEKDWFAQTVLPFVKQDPAYLWRLQRSHTLADEDSPFSVRYPGGGDGL